MSRLTFGADRLLLLYAVVIVWLCIYVPWREPRRYGYGLALGYSFVWNPPAYAAGIDLTRLLLELVAATAALVALAVGREWQRQRRLPSKATTAREPFWPRWGSGEWGPLVLVVMIGLSLVVGVLIFNAIAHLFSGGQ